MRHNDKQWRKPKGKENETDASPIIGYRISRRIMTQNEIRQALIAQGFKRDDDTEYSWETYVKKDYPINYEGKDYKLHIEIGLNYYNVQIQWFYENGRKCTDIIYNEKMAEAYDSLEQFIYEFIKKCDTSYRCKVSKYGR